MIWVTTKVDVIEKWLNHWMIYLMAKCRNGVKQQGS